MMKTFLRRLCLGLGLCLALLAPTAHAMGEPGLDDIGELDPSKVLCFYEHDEARKQFYFYAASLLDGTPTFPFSVGDGNFEADGTVHYSVLPKLDLIHFEATDAHAQQSPGSLADGAFARDGNRFTLAFPSVSWGAPPFETWMRVPFQVKDGIYGHIAPFDNGIIHLKVDGTIFLKHYEYLSMRESIELLQAPVPNVQLTAFLDPDLRLPAPSVLPAGTSQLYLRYEMQNESPYVGTHLAEFYSTEALEDFRVLGQAVGTGKALAANQKETLQRFAPGEGRVYTARLSCDASPNIEHHVFVESLAFEHSIAEAVPAERRFFNVGHQVYRSAAQLGQGPLNYPDSLVRPTAAFWPSTFQETQHQRTASLRYVRESGTPTPSSPTTAETIPWTPVPSPTLFTFPSQAPPRPTAPTLVPVLPKTGSASASYALGLACLGVLLLSRRQR